MTMQRRITRGLPLVALLSALLGSAGCGGAAEPVAETPVTVVKVAATVVTTAPPALPGDQQPTYIDDFSTFQSRDPFVPQQAKAVAVTTTTNQQVAQAPASGPPPTIQLASAPTVTTSPPYTTPPTQLASAHSLRVVSVNTSVQPARVHFLVDGAIFEGRVEGEVVTTSWGQLKIMKIQGDDQSVTFLHGSEIRKMSEGQEYLR